MYYIDIGNSYAKILNDKTDNVFSIESNNIFDWLADKEKDNIIICSVALEVTIMIKKLYPQIKIIDNKLYDKLIEVDNDLIYKKGSDRIVTAYGALKKYSDNLIIVDMGTCVTVDVLINRKYTSGYIFPGLQILRVALNKKVKQLPVAVEPHGITDNIIDTNDQIFWANIYGMIGAINQFVKIEKHKFPNDDFKVILTGGTILEFNQFLKEKKLQELFDFEYTTDSKLIFEAMKQINNLGVL